ncbi:MAG: M50 family metallopeptidase [Alphaproteobacteria bacterium]|nr:M50 family metallopeptidase [Alphaproteobacteria bacterium]
MIARFFDFLLELIKWPVAILAVVILPALIEALNYFQIGNINFFVFAGGMFAYLALKIMASARSNISMQILAHEFTHIFFALITFHKVVHLHLNMDESGGAMGFKGKGNWLITVSPYFFPLFLFFLMLGFTFFSDRLPSGYWANGILGYFFAYHLGSMIVQIHGDQPDFKEAGFLFCLMFLPSANIFSCSAILAFNNGGWINVERYISIVLMLGERYINGFLGYITNL